MATAIHLPAAADAPTLGFFDIVRRLGVMGRSNTWQVAYIDGLIERYGFPKPLPLLNRNRWIEGAHIKARWNRAAVEAWELDRLPPDAATAVDRNLLAEAGERMDARAAALFAPANDLQVA
jgi:hypothetical protein